MHTEQTHCMHNELGDVAAYIGTCIVVARIETSMLINGHTYKPLYLERTKCAGGRNKGIV